MQFAFFIFFLLIGGCATSPTSMNSTGKLPRTKHIKATSTTKTPSRYTQEKDGAPKGPVPSSFKEVKPKSEPLSRYGNPDTYAVEGRTYEVLKNSSGYKARGIASWYGTKFHKQRTSSGDDYDMYAMTAAHKTLPLPTYVKVKI